MGNSDRARMEWGAIALGDIAGELRASARHMGSRRIAKRPRSDPRAFAEFEANEGYQIINGPITYQSIANAMGMAMTMISRAITASP